MAKIKVDFICVSYSYVNGGAGIAAKSFANILKKDIDKFDLNVECLSQDNAGLVQFTKRVFSRLLVSLQRDANPTKHSLNLFSYKPILSRLQERQNSIFHFHWINNDTLSIFNLQKIPKGSIITLHDEWLYCGAEHTYKINDTKHDFIDGYKSFRKSRIGIPWNSIVWRIKYKKLAHRKDLIYTAPSHWLLSRAKDSLILKDADIRLLPNPVDVDVFKPYTQSERTEYRSKLKLSKSDTVIVFGAIGGRSNYLKGTHLLQEALELLAKRLPSSKRDSIKLISFGGGKNSDTSISGYDTISLGHIEERSELSLLYSAADLVIAPSLVESFGQIAAESLACETPVICFNHTGLKDIVIDNVTGLTATSHCSTSLADKIESYLQIDQDEISRLATNGRQHIIDQFSPSVVKEKYEKIISDAYDLKSRK